MKDNRATSPLAVVVLAVGIIALTGDRLEAFSGDDTRGRVIYISSCAPCHGLSGNGQGPAARIMSPLPRDFTAGNFKFRTTPSGQLPTDADLINTIRNGVAGTMMPDWKNILGESDLAAVTSYIKKFYPPFEDQVPDRMPNPGPPPEVTDEAIAEGKALYMVFDCGSCHGVSGKADGLSANSLKDDKGNPLRPPYLGRDPIKGGAIPERIYMTFATGLAGTPMPAFTPDIFQLGSDDLGEDVSSYEASYSQDDIDTYLKWVRSIPTSDAVWSLPDEEREALGEKRMWSLVYYIVSLMEENEPGLVWKMLRANQEGTR